MRADTDAELTDVVYTERRGIYVVREDAPVDAEIVHRDARGIVKRSGGALYVYTFPRVACSPPLRTLRAARRPRERRRHGTRRRARPPPPRRGDDPEPVAPLARRAAA
jgi:hypothetical protein